MKRLNVLYKIFLGDWDHRTKFFPLFQRNIKNLKYSLYNLLFRLKKPAVIFIPVGFFLIQKNHKQNTLNGKERSYFYHGLFEGRISSNNGACRRF